MGETETKESFDMKNYVSPVKKKELENTKKSVSYVVVLGV